MDALSGKPLWLHEGTKISHASIAVGGERVFFAAGQVTPEQRSRTKPAG
jgi:hypothetical protein